MVLRVTRSRCAATSCSGRTSRWLSRLPAGSLPRARGALRQTWNPATDTLVLWVNRGPPSDDGTRGRCSLCPYWKDIKSTSQAGSGEPNNYAFQGRWYEYGKSERVAVDDVRSQRHVAQRNSSPLRSVETYTQDAVPARPETEMPVPVETGVSDVTRLMIVSFPANGTSSTLTYLVVRREHRARRRHKGDWIMPSTPVRVVRTDEQGADVEVAPLTSDSSADVGDKLAVVGVDATSTEK